MAVLRLEPQPPDGTRSLPDASLLPALRAENGIAPHRTQQASAAGAQNGTGCSGSASASRLQHHDTAAASSQQYCLSGKSDGSVKSAQPQLQQPELSQRHGSAGNGSDGKGDSHSSGGSSYLISDGASPTAAANGTHDSTSQGLQVSV